MHREETSLGLYFAPAVSTRGLISYGYWAFNTALNESATKLALCSNLSSWQTRPTYADALPDLSEWVRRHPLGHTAGWLILFPKRLGQYAHPNSSQASMNSSISNAMCGGRANAWTPCLNCSTEICWNTTFFSVAIPQCVSEETTRSK
jgi:hypothetical protein